MSGVARQMHLGLFLLGHGQPRRRLAPAGGDQQLPEHRRNFYADAAAHPSYTLRFEPLTLLAALAGCTECIGLGVTVSTTYSDPFTVARAFASLDHVSKGRAAWNAATGASAEAGPNFGRLHPSHAERYAVAGEFIDVVKGLWDYWADDAVRADRETGVYVDPAKVRTLGHHGRHFDMKGSLNIGRAPQGQPVVLQAGGSVAGLALAARTADVVFSVVQEVGEARAQYAALKAAVAAAGRDPAQVMALPGVMPVLGRTEAEALAKLAVLQGFVGSTDALALLSDHFGADMAGYDLDGSGA